MHKGTVDVESIRTMADKTSMNAEQNIGNQELEDKMKSVNETFKKSLTTCLTIGSTEKLSVAKKTELIEELNRMKSSFEELVHEHIRLLTRMELQDCKPNLEEIKQCIKDEVKKTINLNQQQTYAAATKTIAYPKVPDGKKIVLESNTTSVIITPLDNKNNNTSEETKEAVMKVVDPKKLGIRIRRIIKINNGSVKIESDSVDLESKLQTCEPLTSEFKVQIQPKNKPRLCIFGIKNSMPEESIMQGIKTQNNLLKDSHVKLLFKFGKKESVTCNWVVEVDPETRNILLNSKRVFIDYGSHSVDDHLKLKRCYRCQAFGHLAKDCKAPDNICEHCSGNHDTRTCTHLEENPICINCKKAKLPDNHKASSSKCGIHRRRRKKLMETIDYGDTPPQE